MSDTEDNQTPEGRSLTAQQELIVRLLRAVPKDHWVSFGDLVEAMQVLGHPIAIGSVSNALQSLTTEHVVQQAEMNVWGRVRDEQGYAVWAAQGTDRARGSHIVTNPDHPSNVAFEAAGGLIDGVGRAATSRRYPLVAMIWRKKLHLDH